MKHLRSVPRTPGRGPVPGLPPCVRCGRQIMYFYRRDQGESFDPKDAGRALAEAAHYYLSDGPSYAIAVDGRGRRPVHAVCLTPEDRRLRLG